MSRKSPDRRPPCGRTTIDDKKLWFGGCAQPNSGESPVTPTYTNVTKLLISGSNVDPIPTGHILSASAVDTVPTAYRVQNGQYYNSYSASNTPSMLPTCSKVVGHKRVEGRKKWQGKHARTYVESYPDSIDWCCACEVVGERKTYATTKALTMVGSLTLHRESSGASDKDTAASATATLGRHSGQLVVTCASSSNEVDSGSFAAGALADLVAAGEWDISTVLNTYCAVAGGANTPASVVGSATTGWTLTYTQSFGISSIVSINLQTHTAQIKSYGNTADSPDFIYGQTGQTDIVIGDWSIDFDQWSEISGASPINRSYSETHIDVTLSNGYTSTQCREDLYDLLALFDLGDDNALPWRSTEGNLTYGDLVERYEDKNASLTFGCGYVTDPKYDGSVNGGPLPLGMTTFWNPEFETWEIQTSGICQTKNVKHYGGYMPSKNYTNNWYATQLPSCAFIGSNFLWTTPSTCIGSETYLVNDILYAAKTAEILIEKPSIDFFRPAGLDRLQLSGSHCCVVTASSGVVTLEPLGPPTVLATNDVAWICGVEGNKVDGMWRVTRLGDRSVRLDTRMATASYFPTQSVTNCGSGMIGKLKWHGMPGINGRVDITEIDATNGTFVTCSLREPTYLIVGDIIRVSGSKTFALDNSAWTVTNTIDNQHVVLNAASAGRSSSLYDGHAQMYSNNAPHWKWSDNLPKNEYVIKHFDVEYRSILEYVRLVSAYSTSLVTYDCQSYFNSASLFFCNNVPVPTLPRLAQTNYGIQQEIRSLEIDTHCLDFNACKPSVVYFSPNDEPLLTAKYNCRNHWNAGNFLIDPKYPQLWEGVMNQYMADPFWQAPPCPCSYDDEELYYDCWCDWQEDVTGFCAANTEDPCVKYYALRPMVETRHDIPHGAPSFIQNKLGCKTTATPSVDKPACNWVDNQAHFDYDGFTPELHQIPYHIDYLARQVCVCANGQFAQDYRNQRISCDEEDI